MPAINPLLVFITFIFLTGMPGASNAQNDAKVHRFIEVSPANTSYFTFSDGETYIPNGINMINPSGKYSNNPDSAFIEIDGWMKNLSENGGNYIGFAHKLTEADFFTLRVC